MNTRPALESVRCLITTLFTAGMLFLGQELSTAAPAAPGLHTMQQPDGTVFQARLRGDEFFNYYITADGHPVVYDQDSKWWTYASTAEEGVGPSSGLKAGLDSAPTGPWKPKTPRSELEARATRMYDASVPPVRISRTRGGGVTPAIANVAMLLTTFSDRVAAADPGRPIYQAPSFESLFFSTTDPAAFTAANLFKQMSYGLHTVTSGPAGISGWATAPNTHDYYGGGPQVADSEREDGARVRELVRWRVQNVDSAMNFGPYDTDNDGFVDLVCIIYQGTAQANSGLVNDIWPIRWTLGTATSAGGGANVYQSTDVNANGVAVKINDFIVIPELNPGPTSPQTTIGLFAHEYGHGIGWPDLYDTDYSTSGLGDWCLMAGGNYNQKTTAGVSGDCPCWANAWCRMKCGWLTPVNLTNNQQGYRVPEAKRENAAVRLWGNGQTGSEYYLVENRQRTGWDQGLPGGTTGPASGLLIWHIDETQTTNRSEWWSIPGTGGLTNAGHRKVALEQADKLFHLDRSPGNQGDGGDMYTSASSFTDSTVPSSRAYDGTITNVAVRNIRAASATDASIAADYIINAEAGFAQVVTMDPANGVTYTVVNSVGGTARDNIAVSSVRISLQRHSPAGDEWYAWNTGTWQTGAFDGAAHEVTATLTGSGTTRGFLTAIPAGHVTPASYSFFAKAFDAGLSGSPWRESRFTVVDDPNGPDVTIGEPTNAENYAAGVVPNFQGSAIRTTGTIKVEVAMKMETGAAAGRFYDWTTNSFSPAGIFGAPNAYQDSRTTWVVNMAPRPLGDGGYTLFARVTNGDLRVSPWRAVAFRVGRPFRVIVSNPVHLSAQQQLTEISGTVDDPSGTGLAGGGINLTMTDSGGRYWNGTAWQAAQASFTAPVGSGGSWVFSTMPPTSDLPGGDYTLAASASNNSGEATTPTTGVNSILFRIDRSLPVVSLTSPADGAVINTPGLPVFQGTATDTSGIAWVNCFLRRNLDQAFWTGVEWTREFTGAPEGNVPEHAPSVAFLTASYNAAAGTWQCVSPLPAPGSTMKSGSYNFIVMAGDQAGNYIQRDAAVTVDYHATYTWTGLTLRDGITGNNSTYWDTPANWSPYGVPGEGDIAVIANGDRVDSSSSRTVYGLQLSSGTLNFTSGPGPAGTLSTTHVSTWTGGIMTGIWENQGTLAVSGAAAKTMAANAVLNNRGTVLWQGGGLIRAVALTGISTINNKPGGTFRIAADGTVFDRDNSNHRPVFNNENEAVLEKQGGTGTATLGEWDYNNAGEIRVGSGTLAFVDSASGYDLKLDPGTTLTGSGRLRLQNTTRLSTAVNALCPVDLVAGGYLGCPAPVSGPPLSRFEGTLNWTGGAVGGVLTLGAGGVMNLSDAVAGTPVVKVLDTNMVLHNEGTIQWLGGGRMQSQTLSGFATVNNRGYFHAGADGTVFSRSDGNNTPVFNNEAGGVFRKTGGTGTTLVDTFTFNNAGGIAVDSGVLAFNTTLNLLEGGTLSGLGRFEMPGGRANVTGTTPLSGTTFTVLGGTISGGAGAVWTSPGGGAWRWWGGTLSGTLEIAANSRLLIADPASGPAVKNLATGGILNNKGLVEWSGAGPLLAQSFGGISTINNRSGGQFQITMDGTLFSRSDSNHVPVFNNDSGAVFSKPSGNAAIASTCDWVFNNAGLVQMTGGRLDLLQGGTSSGTFDAANGASLRFRSGTHTLRTGTTFSGTGRIQIDGGTVLGDGVLNGNSGAPGAFELLAGTLGGTTDYTGTGLFHWAGGTVAGTLSLAGGTRTELDGAASKTLANNAVLNNRGTVLWQGGGLIRAVALTGISTINNKPGGTFRIAADGTVFDRDNSNHRPVFNNENEAVLEKQGGTGTATLGEWDYNNAGEIRVGSGTLAFVDSASGYDLKLDPGTTLTGSGRLRLQNTTRLSTAVNALCPVDLVAGGYLGCPAPVSGPPLSRFEGTLNWTGGAIGGVLTLGAGGVMNLSDAVAGTPVVKVLDTSAVLHNEGTIHWLGGGSMHSQTLSGFATVNNRGNFHAGADGTVFSRSDSNNTPVFNNEAGGVFRKTGGTGTTVVNTFTFHHRGGMVCDSGVIGFNTSMTIQSAVPWTGAGDFEMQNGNATVSGELSLNGPALTILAGGVNGAVDGSGAFTTTGGSSVEWKGGFFARTLRVTAGSSLNLSGAAAKTLAGSSVLNNDGTIVWQGGGPLRAVTLSAICTVNNRIGGRFHAAANGVGFDRTDGNYTPIFNNAGSFQIGASLGACQFSSWRFNQSATGALDIEVAGPALTEFDRLTLSGGGITLGGSLNVTKLNGYTPAVGTTFAFLTGPSRTGNFASVNASGFAVDYTAGGATLRATAGSAFDNWASGLGLTGADALPTADGDGDGIPLFMEYALGLDPTVRSTDGYPDPTLNPDRTRLEIRFSRRTPSDLTYYVENPYLPAPGNIIATLLPGATAWTGSATVTETGTGASRRVVVIDPTVVGTVNNDYLRLRVVGTQ